LLPPPLPLVAAVLVSLAFAAWLSWYFSRPIRSLNAAFDALADGNLDTRVGSAMGSRSDELADLGQAFDRSAVKLQALVETQRRLLHDVSHELRSPLARLQACTDLMLQQPQRSAELVKRVERETARMDALVGELLTLARLDSGAQQLRSEVVDLSELLHTLCADAQLELESKQCAVDLNVQSAVTLQGDFELLYRALDNILRNAIRYAPGGSSITVGLRKHTNLPQATVTIADRGPGLPTEDIVAIFEPFYRSAQNSEHIQRNADQGYGLGLAITRSIVHSHGGTVVAQNRPEGGLEMHVTFPLARY
jgi:signal transduction histidine kinase